MDRDTFAKCLEPALEYYGHTLTETVWQFYFEELGGMTIPELNKAVRNHMASLKSFPLTSHLRPERKAQIQSAGRQAPRMHQDFSRTHIDCINIFHARIQGNAFAGNGSETTYPINIYPVISQAVAYYNDKLVELGEHAVASQCRSGIFMRLIKEFDGLPQI